MPVYTSQLLLLIAPSAHCRPAPAFPGPSVATPQGIYHPNTSIAGIEQFLGIPYAAPPVGPLRFADPTPYDPSGHAGEHVNATRYGPGCLQGQGTESGLSEDCLTLNIFRPASGAYDGGSGAGMLGSNGDDGGKYEEEGAQRQSGAAKQGHAQPPPLLPVLVFIYGGANIGGQSRHYSAPNLVLHSLGALPLSPLNDTSSSSSSSSSSSASARPVLVVTLNYRTGGLGFLTNTAFARLGLLNTGLKDQRAALEWVHANVAAFGGDPERVTIFGQSAGSFNVWMQIRREALGRGDGKKVDGQERQQQQQQQPLFRGAIMESGGPGSVALRGMRPEDGDAFFDASLKAVGCPSTRGRGGGKDEEEAALACLREVSAEELVRVWFDNSSALLNTLDDFVQMPVGFGVDGEWIRSENYWDEAVADIPLIVGDTLNEGSLYGRVPTGLATNETYLAQLVANLSLAKRVVATYYAHTAAENWRGYKADRTAPDSYYVGEAVLGDAVQDIPRRITLGKHASGADRALQNTTNSAAAKTWGYRWTQKPPLSLFNESFYGFPPDVPDANKVRAGVLHASELGSVFGDLYGWADAGERDRRLARLVQSMWISFAYDQDPNNHGIPDVPHWDNYDPRSAAIFNFEDQGSTRPSMIPDDVRLDSYNAYKDAAAKANLPPLPEIKV